MPRPVQRGRKIPNRMTPTHTLPASIDAFYRRCEARNLSSHTLEFYRYRFQAFIRYLEEEHGGLITLEAITPSLIRDFLAYET